MLSNQTRTSEKSFLVSLELGKVSCERKAEGDGLRRDTVASTDHRHVCKFRCTLFERQNDSSKTFEKQIARAHQ